VKPSNKDLIKYRVDRAFETLEEANILAQYNHWDTVANRLYYSCFYAVSALFYKFNLTAKTHSSFKSQFHKNFIKNGVFDLTIYGEIIQRSI